MNMSPIEDHVGCFKILVTVNKTYATFVWECFQMIWVNMEEFPPNLSKSFENDVNELIQNRKRLPDLENKLVVSDVGFPGGSEIKVSACNAGDPGLIPRSGRSPGEGNGNPLQSSCLGNPMDGGAW